MKNIYATDAAMIINMKITKMRKRLSKRYAVRKLSKEGCRVEVVRNNKQELVQPTK